MGVSIQKHKQDLWDWSTGREDRKESVKLRGHFQSFLVSPHASILSALLIQLSVRTVSHCDS